MPRKPRNILGPGDGLTSRDINGSYRSIGRDDDERTAMWRDYLLDLESKKDEPLFRSGSTAVGSDDFKGRVLLENGRPRLGRKGKPRKKDPKT